MAARYGPTCIQVCYYFGDVRLFPCIRITHPSQETTAVLGEVNYLLQKLFGSCWELCGEIFSPCYVKGLDSTSINTPFGRFATEAYKLMRTVL